MSQLKSVIESTTNWALQRQIALVSEAVTGSTNDDAKAQATNETADFTLYVSDHQSSGRGRGQNHWFDTGAGESLLSTWSFHVPSPPQAITGPRIGLALFNAASKTWPSLAWGLKAPNDVLVDGAKMAGLLIEAVSHGSKHRLLIGLGFNVLNHPRRFSEATHLGHSLGHPLDEGEWFMFMDELREQFSAALTDITEATLSESSCQDLRQALNANAKKSGTILSVSEHGDLHLASGKIRWTDL